MNTISSASLTQAIYDERVAEAEAHGAYAWLPEDGTNALDAIIAALRAFVTSLRPGQRSADVRQPAS